MNSEQYKKAKRLADEFDNGDYSGARQVVTLIRELLSEQPENTQPTEEEIENRTFQFLMENVKPLDAARMRAITRLIERAG